MSKSDQMMELSNESIEALKGEILRARVKFPRNRFLYCALGEESGELAEALLQKQGRNRVQAEALQVACVAMRIYEEGDASFDDITDEEAKA